MVVRGHFKGQQTGKVVNVHRRKFVVHVERMQREKVNGSTVQVGIHPSNCVITKLKLDKDRTAMLTKRAASKEANLESVRAGGDVNNHAASVLGWSLISVLARVESSDRESVTERFGKFELRPIWTLDAVLGRVELQAARQRQGHRHLRARHETVGGGVGVVSSCKVTVVAGDNGVLFPLLDILSVPLSNTGTTGVGQNNSSKFPHCIRQSISLNGSSDLFTPRGDVEGSLALETLGQGLLHQ